MLIYFHKTQISFSNTNRLAGKMMPNPFFDKHSNPLVSGTSSVRGSKEKSKEKKKDKKSVDATKSSESKSVGSKLTNLFSFSKVNVTQSQTEQSIPQGNDNNKTSDTIPLKHNDSDQPVAPEIPHMPEPRSSQLVFESAEAVQHHSSQHEDSEIDISYRYDVDPFTGIPNRFKKGSRSATTSTKSRNKHIKEAEEALFARQHGKYQAPEDIPLDKLEQFLRDHPHVMDGSKRRSLSQSSEREHQESEPKDRLRYKMIIADAAKYFLHEEKGEIILEYVTTVQEIVDAFVVNHMNAHVIKWTDYVGAYMKVSKTLRCFALHANISRDNTTFAAHRIHQ